MESPTNTTGAPPARACSSFWLWRGIHQLLVQPASGGQGVTARMFAAEGNAANMAKAANDTILRMFMRTLYTNPAPHVQRLSGGGHCILGLDMP